MKLLNLIKKRIYVVIIGFLPLLFIFQNCHPPIKATSIEQTGSLGTMDPTITDPNLIGSDPNPITNEPGTPIIDPIPEDPPSKYVCDPFGSDVLGSSKSGLVAHLGYFNQSQYTDDPRQFLVKDYFNKDDVRFVQAEEKIYFSQINTPPRVFSDGFQNEKDFFITDSTGKKLIEWFGLSYETVLKLSENDSEGSYQLSTISDDGVIVEAFINNKWVNIISDDGQHSPKMGCSTTTLEMTKESRIPLRVFYFQGPRNTISNMLLWKNVTANLQYQDLECGNSGNEYFWDRTLKIAKDPLINIYSRDWKVLSEKNFLLPNNSTNPCVP